MSKIGKFGILLLVVLVLTSACETTSEPPANQFKAGTYKAVARGHNENFEVSVIFTENKITDIIIGQNDETGFIGETGMGLVRDQILTYQTANVDTVSGATVSSGAFLAAVQDCVKQAGGNPAAMQKPGLSAQKYNDTKTQVVVVGSGSAGLSAVMEAKLEQGLNVILVEQLGIIGGSSGRSGYLMGGGTKLQRDAGINYSKNDFVKYMTSAGGTTGIGGGGTAGGNNTELDQGMFQMNTAVRIGEQAGENVDWLSGLGVIFEVNNTNQFRGNGSRFGPYMMRAMQKQLDSNKIDYRLNTKVTEIIMEDGKATGVKVTTRDGIKYNIKADAVIIATGGYNSNNDLIKRFNPKFNGYPTDSSIGADGSGYLMVEKVGGVLKFMDQGNFHCFAVVWRGAPRNMASTIAAGAIAVNKEGKRFVNEGTYYDESCCNAVLSQTGGVCYVLFDKPVANNVIVPGDNNLANNIDMYKVGNTIEELAEKLGINPVELATTIENYKKIVADGNDPEFGRSKNIMKTSFETGPFYGCEAKPELHSNFGGIIVDIDNRVLNAGGKIIPGLYAAGEAAASHVLGTAPNTICVFNGRNAARAVKAQISGR